MSWRQIRQGTFMHSKYDTCNMRILVFRKKMQQGTFLHLGIENISKKMIIHTNKNLKRKHWTTTRIYL